MANFGKLLLTNVGLQEQYKAQSGQPLKFKRIAMGSGNYSGNVMALTKLVTENVSVDISKGYVQNNAYTVEGFFSNEGLQTGFAWREIGLFVEDSNGNEVLYCYANAGDTYDYIPATEDERYSKYIRIATAIGNATNISIVESEGILYVDTRTFNELALEVEQMWPSKSLIGSVVVVEDSANLPFAGMNIYGKSAQIKTEGNQLVNLEDSDAVVVNGITWSCKDGVIRAKGTSTAISSSGMEGIAARVEGLKGTYFISGDTDNVKVLAAIQLSDGTSLWKHNQSFTLDGTESHVTVYCQIEAGVTVNTAIYPMLNVGNSPLPWEKYTGGAPSPSPEHPQEIVNVGNGGIVRVNVLGKNLFDITADSMVVVGASGSERYGYIFDLTGTYTFSCKTTTSTSLAYKIITDGVYGEYYTYMGDVAFTVTLAENQKLLIYKGAEDRFANGVTYAQLEKGDTATEYEPYSKQTLAIHASNGLSGIPVSSGGNYTDENGKQWICDEVDLERGVYIKRIKKVTLDGSESWQKNDENDDNKYLYFIRVNDVGLDASLCDKLIRKSTNTLNKSGVSADSMGIYVSKSYQVIYLNINTIMTDNTVDGLKSVLSDNPLTVIYPLATPIETALSDAEIAAYQALHSNNPTTTIFNDSGAGMVVQYITKSHEAVVGKLVSQIDNLKEEVKRLKSRGTYGLEYFDLAHDAEGNVKHYSCSGIGTAIDTDICIPSAIQGIPVVAVHGGAFIDCSYLKSAIISDGIASIIGRAFENCISLTSVKIPKSVINISNGAFIGCERLKDVYYEGTEAMWDEISEGVIGLGNATIHFNCAV